MDAAAIIDEYDMHCLPGTRPAKMTGISGDRLAGGAAREEPQINTQVTTQRDEFFDPHTRNVYVGEVSAHIGIAFIGANDEFPGLGNGEVDPGKRYPTRQEFLPE